jgi:hypothetical protein
MKEIIDLIKADPRYRKNIKYGQPRSGHPEGKVEFHIEDLEANLEALLIKGISHEDYWKLKFLIHIHDSFKAEAINDVPVLDERSHATIAKKFAGNFINDTDLLNMIQFHDENYKLWQEYSQTGLLNNERFQSLLNTIENWDLFLMFIIIDGCVKGKDYSKLTWFINEVRKHKATIVDSSWILAQQNL